MIVNLPTIQSNVDSSLCQMIIPRTFYDNGWIYNFFCRLHYDKEVGAVTFENYNTFMNEGVLLKRYFEYPWKPDTDLNEVFRFLVLYLKKGYLIVNYLENFTYNGRNYKPCILFYDYDEPAGQLKFFCWGYDNQIQSFSMTIKELFADIQKANIEKEKKFRFDLKRFVKQEGLGYKNDLVKKQFKTGRLGGVKFIYYVEKMNARQVEISICTVREWFEIFQQRLKFLGHSEELHEAPEFMELIKDETFKDRKKYLRRLIKMYNELCELFAKSAQGEL